MGMKNKGGLQKIGRSGQPVPSDEKLPDTVKDVPGQLQPGGIVFDKPRRSTSGVVEDTKSGKDGKASTTPVIKGMPVSGRSWKLEAKRMSSMQISMNSKAIRKPWEAKMAEKAVNKAIQAKQKKLIDARIEAKREKKREDEERIKRKEANRLKSTVVQAVSTATVRKMSRKQLRNIRKMDVHSVINPAPIKKTKGLKGKVLV